MKWIKCSERMPDEFVKECLVVNKGETCFALHGINRWGDRYFIEPYEDGDELDDITYWMPLPEPPNVKK